MTINPGDKVYIEASMANGKNPGDWTIKGLYEIYKISKTNIWLIEEGLIIKILRSRIAEMKKK